MTRKKKESAKTVFKVFAFMINPHEMIMVSEEGKKLAKLTVESDVQAKEKLGNEQLNQEIIVALGRPDFSTIWVDDPAGNPEVLDACRMMEQPDADAILSDAVNGQEKEEESVVDQLSEEIQVPPPQRLSFSSLNPAGGFLQVQILMDGKFKSIAFGALQIGDVIRMINSKEEPVGTARTTLFRVEKEPEERNDAGVDYYVFEATESLSQASQQEPTTVQEPIADTVDESNQDKTSAGPQFSDQTKIIEVECVETYSEREIKELGRRIRTLKAEALQSAAEYREDIKKLEKRFFEMCDGKSYTQMKCRVETDWKAGVRRYIRPDTEEVAKIEKISHEEMQMRMDLPVPGKSEENSKESTVPENPQEEAPPIDESVLTSEAITEATQGEPNSPESETESAYDETAEEARDPEVEGPYEGEEIDFPPPSEEEMENVD